MSDQSLTKRVQNLEFTLFDTKFNLANANVDVFKLKERLSEKHNIRHIDWIHHLFEHEPGLDVHEKKRLASTIMSILFKMIGNDLLDINPEELNITYDGLCLAITRKGRVIMRGQSTFMSLKGLNAEVERLAKGA